MRMRARSTSRTAICSRSTASPVTTGGRTARGSPTASTGRSIARTCRSTTTSARATGSTSATSIFPEGTGPYRPVSDIVGRTRIRYGRFIDITHRFRIDKDNFAVRRNELDLTIGTDADLCADRLSEAQPQYRPGDRGSARQGRVAASPARIKFRHYWSVFGATVIDLTDKSEDPFSLADGFSRFATVSASNMKTNACSLA